MVSRLQKLLLAIAMVATLVFFIASAIHSAMNEDYLRLALALVGIVAIGSIAVLEFNACKQATGPGDEPPPAIPQRNPGPAGEYIV